MDYSITITMFVYLYKTKVQHIIGSEWVPISQKMFKFERIERTRELLLIQAFFI